MEYRDDLTDKNRSKVNFDDELNKLMENLVKSGINIENVDVNNLIYDFENSMDKEYKKAHGIVYTPQWVADGMARLAIKKWLNKVLDFDYTSNLNITQLEELKEKLDNIRICDPCVGAGVYIFSIIKVLSNIYSQINRLLNTEDKKLDTLINIIKNNIFAIDIDSNAVMITKFRLWAFLIDNGYDKSLNEFECNIYIGDAVNQTHDGLNIEYNRDLDGIDGEIREEYIDDWQYNWDEYIQAKENSKGKYITKAKLLNTALEISSIRTGKEPSFNIDWKMVKNNRLKLFNWYLEYNNIFNQNESGFDIIIGNPPYVRNIEAIDSEVLGNSADLYMHFLELLKKRGNKNCQLCMIVPSNWFSSSYAKNFRDVYKPNIDTIIDFNMHYIFDKVYVSTAIVLMNNDITTDMDYANVERIEQEGRQLEFDKYIGERLIKINKNRLEAETKFIFGEDKLYNTLDKFRNMRCLRDVYNVDIIRGIVIPEKNRINGGNKPYLAMGKDTKQFGLLDKTDMSTDLDIQYDFNDCIIIPEVTRKIRACRIKDIIPLDSLIVLKSNEKNLLGLLNSEIFDMLFNILVSTNFCISYAEVRFPRKNKMIGNVPVPDRLDSLEDLRLKTNNWEDVTDEDKEELNKVIQRLYGLTDEEVDILRKYNI